MRAFFTLMAFLLVNVSFIRCADTSTLNLEHTHVEQVNSQKKASSSNKADTHCSLDGQCKCGCCSVAHILPARLIMAKISTARNYCEPQLCVMPSLTLPVWQPPKLV